MSRSAYKIIGLAKVRSAKTSPWKADAMSDYLFARPKAIYGLASLFDVWGSPCPYNYSASDEEADARATWSDWLVTSRDLRDGMRKHGRGKSHLVRGPQKVTIAKSDIAHRGDGAVVVREK